MASHNRGPPGEGLRLGKGPEPSEQCDSVGQPKYALLFICFLFSNIYLYVIAIYDHTTARHG